MDLNQTVDRRPSSGSGDVRRSHHLEFVFESVEGFGASIVAIGLARAWLSLQTGIVAAFLQSCGALLVRMGQRIVHWFISMD